MDISRIEMIEFIVAFGMGIVVGWGLYRAFYFRGGVK